MYEQATHITMHIEYLSIQFTQYQRIKYYFISSKHLSTIKAVRIDRPTKSQKKRPSKTSFIKTTRLYEASDDTIIICIDCSPCDCIAPRMTYFLTQQIWAPDDDYPLIIDHVAV